MNNSRPVGRIFCCRTQVMAVVTSILLSTIALAALAEEKSQPAAKSSEAEAAATPNPDVSRVFTEVETLVKEYYPKAKFVRTGDKLHFDYKARGLAGAQSGLKELSPDSGGVAGDIVVKQGKYTGRERNPSETNLILHMVLFMAPYSEPTDQHFFTRLSYPPDASVDFLTRFKSIIGEMQKGNQEVAAKPAAVTSQNAPPAVQTPTSNVKATGAENAAAQKAEGDPGSEDFASALAVKPNSKELTPAKVSFGAHKLSKYSYPEGRFKVLLPGNPQMKYSNQLGMRSVDYSYPETQGAYVMSYLIAPGFIAEDKVGALLDAVCTNIAKTTKSVELRRNSLNLQGYQGRQIELAPGSSKEQLARFRLYVVRRFIYIIGAAGNKAWVDSPVVGQYLNSLEVSPELTASEQHAVKMAQMARESEQRKKESDEKWAKSQQSFRDAESRNRKDFERSQANSKYRRY